MHKRLIEDNLDMLRERLLIMGGAAEKAIMLALRALTERDSELAERVIREDDVDGLYDQLYAKLIDAMMRNPAAVPRGAQWLFVLKHLERIADYVTNICEQIVYMARGQVIKHTI